jgi:hypothetical protein
MRSTLLAVAVHVVSTAVDCSPTSHRGVVVADDTGTDWAATAERLRHRATQNAIVRSYGIMPSSRPEDDDLDRLAAVGLRRLAQLDTAIGAQPELADSLRKAQAIIRHKFSPAVANPVQRAAEMMDRLAAVLGSGEQPEGTEPRRPLPPVNPGQRMPGGPTPQP